MKRFLRAAATLIMLAGCLTALWPAGQWGYGVWKQYSLRATWRTAQTQRADAKEAISVNPMAALAAASEGSRPQQRPPASKADHKDDSPHQHRTTTPHPTPRRTRWLPTRLIIPDIDLDTMVVQGVDEAALRDGPGHDPASAFPGNPGNCVIAGHRNAYGWWFYKLGELGSGARILLRTPEETFTYEVASTRVLHENDTWVLRPPGPHAAPRLTLYTCALPHGSQRIVVTANLKRIATP